MQGEAPMPLEIHTVRGERADVLRELIGDRYIACRGIALDLLAVEVVSRVTRIASSGIEAVLHDRLGTHTRNRAIDLDMEVVHRQTQLAGHRPFEMRSQHKAGRVSVG